MKLIKLINFLNREKLSKYSNKIISAANDIPGYKRKVNDQNQMGLILNYLGLAPRNVSESVLDKAALYLSEGINNNSLGLSALNIVAMIPGLQDTFTILRNKNDKESCKASANKIKAEMGRIKTIFAKLKNPQARDYIAYYIPHGELLSIYSDRMIIALQLWTDYQLSTDQNSK